MVLLNNAPMPAGDALVFPAKHPQADMVTRAWQDWFTNLMAIQEKASVLIDKVSLRNQDTAIGATAITTKTLNAGYYKIEFYLRLQAIDSASSNVTTTFRFTWNGAARAVPSGTLAANTLAQTVSNPLPLIQIDANTSITYETTAAFGGTGGAYALDILLFEVEA